jgi:hypothetical protein
LHLRDSAQHDGQVNASALNSKRPGPPLKPFLLTQAPSSFRPSIRQTHLQLIATRRTVNAAPLALDELTEVVVELDVDAHHHPARVTIGDEAWAAFGMPVSPRARRSLPIAMDDENTCVGQRLACLCSSSWVSLKVAGGGASPRRSTAASGLVSG